MFYKFFKSTFSNQNRNYHNTKQTLINIKKQLVVRLVLQNKIIIKKNI
jgi:hypothetical protein